MGEGFLSGAPDWQPATPVSARVCVRSAGGGLAGRKAVQGWRRPLAHVISNPLGQYCMGSVRHKGGPKMAGSKGGLEGDHVRLGLWPHTQRSGDLVLLALVKFFLVLLFTNCGAGEQRVFLLLFSLLDLESCSCCSNSIIAVLAVHTYSCCCCFSRGGDQRINQSTLYQSFSQYIRVSVQNSVHC